MTAKTKEIKLPWTQPSVNGVGVTADFSASTTKRGSRKPYTLHRDRIAPALAAHRKKFVETALKEAMRIDSGATWP